MRKLSKEELKNFINEGFICLYDSIRVSEYNDDTNSIMSDYLEDVKFEDINFDYLVIYEQDESESLNSDLEEVIKTIKKCLNDQKKFEQGKSCTVIMDSGCDILGEEELRELFDLYKLFDRLYDLEICYLRVVK